ncbi:DUF2301 domain-containing membrane protein [Prochlorothrix hollandica]|uniref:Integral membrane protein n=1 Tax=Prochlorothrix hollandica PCC 9006 = CALU 1027 TaxID=317619 RepID=A0A0M2PPG0_PROHO|nr:DUF2301 domain-containing membrane protein [Prochlorothrix hollandica]KKI98465.1 integral membrane protein [Prochlorothrix hollandica PCC 9006 = CALU 1027]
MDSPSPVYQGQFGSFTITPHDRTEVRLYRAGLAVAALCCGVATGLVIWQGEQYGALAMVDWLLGGFCLGLGLSLWTIHIYLRPLHRLLQVFWAIGSASALILRLSQPDPLALYVYHHPLTLLGVGFVFAALTGIYFKEGFCFNRLETKILTPLVPALLLGHLAGVLSPSLKLALLGIWAVLFLIFSARKLIQEIPADIGDKSVFDHLQQQRLQTQTP